MSNQLQTESNKPVILQYLEKHKGQIAAALPKHLTADRMARIVMTEISKNKELLNCSPKSFFGAVIQASQLGLEPGNAMGHCYLIPFNNRQAKTKDVQLIVGYRGMIDLARRSGQIESIVARVVYQGDTFTYSYGLEDDLRHTPGDPDERGDVTHIYAMAKLKGGGVQWEVMTRADIDKIRNQHSKAKSSPWDTHWEEMGKKTVIRRLYKYLPVSIEIQNAVGLDEQADAGVDQKLGSVIDITDDDYQVEDEQAQQNSGMAALKDKLKKGKEAEAETTQEQAEQTSQDQPARRRRGRPAAKKQGGDGQQNGKPEPENEGGQEQDGGEPGGEPDTSQNLQDVAPAEEFSLGPTAVDIAAKITDSKTLEDISLCQDLIRSLPKKADRDRLSKKADARENELREQGVEA